MPFGLSNTPAMFKCPMESCLGDMHLNWCIFHLDDIIVFSKTPEDHIQRLRGVFEKLSAAGFDSSQANMNFLNLILHIWNILCQKME